MGASFNLFYFAQETHGRRVLAGFARSGVTLDDRLGMLARVRPPSPSPPRPPPSRGYVMGNMILDHVLERPGHLALTNAVDVGDPDALAASGATHVVLHKNLLHEFFRRGDPRDQSGLVASA